MEFTQFAKIPRLNRDCIVTEKIDGTNAQVCIVSIPLPELFPNTDSENNCIHAWASDTEITCLYAGSRTRWVTPKSDNAGFASWVLAHAEELKEGLGVGQHFGEWWGHKIGRGYGLLNGDKRFSLFNTARWNPDNVPSCCGIVPVLYRGPFNTDAVNDALESLWKHGSYAAEGYNRPEGIVVYHEHAKSYFKVTLENDEISKGEADYRARQERGTKPSGVLYREMLESLGTKSASGEVNSNTISGE